jgi:hypothetical protein
MKTATVKLFLMILLFLQAFGHSLGQGTIGRPAKYDTAYIFDYKNLLTMRLYGLIQDTRLVLDQDQSGKIIFKPNIPYKIGVAGFYKWFGLGLAIGSPLSFIDEDKNGKTEAFDLRLNLYSNIFAIEGQLQRFKGFYISNFPGTAGKNFTSPDMLVYSIGAAGYYIYNYKRFSMRSAYVQTEWQKKSAGSLMVRLGINVSTMDDPGGMIPADFIEMYHFDSLRNFTQATLVSLSLAPGYGYNLVVFKRCYLHAAVFTGPAYNSITDRSVEGNDMVDLFSMLVFLRGAMGYNGKKFVAGFSAILYGFQPFASEEYNFYLDPPQFRIWAGMRFDVFKKKDKKK